MDRPRPPLFTGEPFERLVALLIALVALLAAFAGYLEATAGARSDTALRNAQQYALQAVGTRTRGEINVGYALSDAFRLWLEVDSQAAVAELTGDLTTATKYGAVRDTVADLSPLLDSGYFDREVSSLPDINAYESDIFMVQSVLLTEQFKHNFNSAESWDGKAQRYVTHLTLLTVTLFLYGLSTTVVGRVGYWFMGIGTLISTFTLVWMVLVVLEPTPDLPEAAMVAYAEGVGLRHQDRYAEAVVAFEEALTFAPEYAAAYYEKARANFQLRDYAQAISDYRAAIDNGRTDTNTLWNLGWTYYIAGLLDSAIDATEAALALDSEQVALHFNLGLMQLAAGDGQAAQQAYEIGAQLVSQQVIESRAAGGQPPGTLWWYMGQASADLVNLNICLSEQLCSDAPPASAVEQTDAPLLTKLQTQLNGLAIALEYDVAPAEDMLAAVENLDFAEAVYDDEGVLVEYRPIFNDTALRGAGTFEDEGELADVNITRSLDQAPNDIFITFDYDGVLDGQLIVAKVYADGREIPTLRLVEAWTLGADGQAVLPLVSGSTFTLQPGNYHLDLYIDALAVASGDFVVGSQ